MRSLFLVCAFSLLALPALAQGRGDPLEQARVHYQSASAYFEHGQYDGAIREFLASYKLSNRAELLYNVAKCYVRKGDAARAVDYYRGYLDGKPRATDRAQVESLIHDLEPRIGRVRLDGVPQGSAISINGAPIDVTPHGPVTATAGTATVEVRLADGTVRTMTVQVTAGRETALRLDAAPTKPTVTPAVAVTPMSAAKANPEPDAEKPASPWFTDKPAWAVAGVGAALLIGVAPLAVFAGRQTDQTETARNEDDYLQHRDNAKALRASTIAAAVAGTAALGVAAVLFATHTKRETKSGVALRVVPTGAGLAVAGAF